MKRLIKKKKEIYLRLLLEISFMFPNVSLWANYHLVEGSREKWRTAQTNVDVRT